MESSYLSAILVRQQHFSLFNVYFWKRYLVNFIEPFDTIIGLELNLISVETSGARLNVRVMAHNEYVHTTFKNPVNNND